MRDKETLRVQTTIRLPDELMAQLKRRADQVGVSVNAMIILMIQAGLKE